ncbi:MAG: tyrosine-type recombinase/integrase [Aliifodinibius sp.]|nr:tyrosine-type recombinase/integrase [Fodinibius sp.]NIY30198.1 tyrosine-type recombinase/integrase [Fodinibius sp.]
MDDQKRALRMFMEHVGKNIQLQKISPKQAESFIAARLSSGVTVATVNKDIRTLKGIFNRAIETRCYLPSGHNPFGNIKERKRAQKQVRYVSVAEYQALSKTAESIRWRAVISVAYGSGLRRGEILNLTWSDIDFENHQIYITAKSATEAIFEWEPKDHEARVLPLTEETTLLLNCLQTKCAEGCPYVFLPAKRWEYIQRRQQTSQWQEGQALVNNFDRDFHKLRGNAGVAECTLHDLRRSCITNWARILPIHVVQKLAGHSDIKTTQKYYLSVEENYLEKARAVQTEILRCDLTDPKLTHSGKKAAFSRAKRKIA